MWRNNRENNPAFLLADLNVMKSSQDFRVAISRVLVEILHSLGTMRCNLKPQSPKIQEQRLYATPGHQFRTSRLR